MKPYSDNLSTQERLSNLQQNINDDFEESMGHQFTSFGDFLVGMQKEHTHYQKRITWLLVTNLLLLLCCLGYLIHIT